MKVRELMELLDAKCLTPDVNLDTEITCGSTEEVENAADHIRKMADEYQPMKDLQLLRMTHHKREGNLSFTDYEDGTCVICNYGDEACQIKGVNIPSHEYAVIRP